MFYALVDKNQKKFVGVTDYKPNVPQEIILYNISKTAHDNIQENKWYFDIDLGEARSYPEKILEDRNRNKSIDDFIRFVNSHMNFIAREYGYNSILEAISFSSSENMRWRNEAMSFISWRDKTLTLLYKNIKDFNDRKIDLLPSGEAFTKQPEYSRINIENASRPSYFRL